MGPRFCGDDADSPKPTTSVANEAGPTAKPPPRTNSPLPRGEGFLTLFLWGGNNQRQIVTWLPRGTRKCTTDPGMLMKTKDSLLPPPADLPAADLRPAIVLYEFQAEVI
jgi:hypothetical protein